MSDDSRQLGRVRKADLFIEDHGFITLFLYIDFGSSEQGFGGAVLGYGAAHDTPAPHGAGMDYIARVLGLFDAGRLSEIEGRYVYALREGGWNSRIVGLEMPAPDGGAKFLVADWQAYWANLTQHAAGIAAP